MVWQKTHTNKKREAASTASRPGIAKQSKAKHSKSKFLKWLSKRVLESRFQKQKQKQKEKQKQKPKQKQKQKPGRAKAKAWAKAKQSKTQKHAQLLLLLLQLLLSLLLLQAVSESETPGVSETQSLRVSGSNVRLSSRPGPEFESPGTRICTSPYFYYYFIWSILHIIEIWVD